MLLSLVTETAQKEEGERETTEPSRKTSPAEVVPGALLDEGLFEAPGGTRESPARFPVTEEATAAAVGGPAGVACRAAADGLCSSTITHRWTS